MKRWRFTKTQFIGTLKKQEIGPPTAEDCRKHGINRVTFYKYEPGSTAWILLGCRD